MLLSKDDKVQKLLLVSSGTLFGTKKELAFGDHRQYNVIEVVYTNLKVYHFLIKKCTTPNRLRRYA